MGAFENKLLAIRASGRPLIKEKPKNPEVQAVKKQNTPKKKEKPVKKATETAVIDNDSGTSTET